MNDNDYKEALFYAASIFNERLGAEFSEDNLVLRCFQTENQQEVFEQFCKQYFPDRLEDRYTEDGYFDFHASAFVGTGDGADGILLRTDIARHPAELKHILLHELAHIFCTRNEIDGDNFFERYCMDDTISREEDGTINAGYAVWRELIAELIAFELDDNCDVVPVRRKKDLLSYYEGELLTGNGKMGVSMILCEAMTSAEGEASMTWDAAKSKFTRFKPFDDPLYRDLMELVFTHVREYFIVIDRDFIYEIGVLYLSIAAQAMIASLKNRFQEEQADRKRERTGNDMKYKLFRSPGNLDKAVQKHELVAVETGKNIDDVADALIRAVRDDLAEMPEYAHCETAAYAPEPVQEHRRVRRYQYEMMGVVYPQYAEKNILIDYGVIEEAE